MTWLSHCLIAIAVTAPLCGSIPAVVLGATAPDWLEWLLEVVGKPVRHRRETHYLLFWMLGVALFGCFAMFFRGFLYPFWFFVGGLTHILADAMTVTGVYFSPWSLQKITFLKGKFRTGEPGEYVFSVGIFLFSFFIGWCSMPPIGKGADCLVVRRDWCEGSKKVLKVGNEKIPLVSKEELRKHRFEWF